MNRFTVTYTIMNLHKNKIIGIHVLTRKVNNLNELNRELLRGYLFFGDTMTPTEVIEGLELRRIKREIQAGRVWIAERVRN